MGRFISPDTIVPNPANPQSFNRYSYCLNNPLKYVDPDGQMSYDATMALLNLAYKWSSGLAITQKELMPEGIPELKPSWLPTRVDIGKSINIVVNDVLDRAGNALSYVKDSLQEAIGVESIEYINTSLVEDLPVINVREGSLLDKVMPDPTITLYPVAVFTNEPMERFRQEEEGYHWMDQKKSDFLPSWYAQYITEVAYYSIVYGGYGSQAHNAISFERTAMGYAQIVTNNPPPPPYMIDWYRANMR